ncbi:MAG: FHA domain-containing protein [Acidothermus sp.]|nr:FHA domain-containing protein [Acidothermus sp.]MCL6538699.1 FHA domain-containing protein [Acidothermus sp.]
MTRGHADSAPSGGPPQLYVETTGRCHSLDRDVTTIGCGDGVDVTLPDPSVSPLHAELVRRGPFVYVNDVGLSARGTRVNGRLVSQHVLSDGDVVSFGSVRCRIRGITAVSRSDAGRRIRTPALTRREREVLLALCRPIRVDAAFVAPATTKEIAENLVVTEAAVKQHLLRLYAKFGIPEGPARRTRLANEVIQIGVIRALQEEFAELPADRAG